MKKICLIACLFVLTNFICHAQNSSIKDNWAVQAVKVKATAQTTANGLPFVSKVILPREKAQKLDVDLKGLKEVVLITWGTDDGNNFDRSLWADAKFYRADGSIVWLSDVKFKEKNITNNWWFVDKNTSGRPLAIAGKQYEKGVIAHANSSLVVDVARDKFVRFTAEIGIDDDANKGSVVFKILPSNGSTETNLLKTKYPDAYNHILELIGNKSVNSWITTNDNSVEIDAIKKSIDRLKEKDPAKKKLSEVSQITNNTLQLSSMYDLKVAIDKVSKIQEQLEWLNIQSIEKAVKDMNNDVAREKFAKLKDLASNNFSDIYNFDAKAIENAETALKLKKDILLSNPALDIDKIIVTRHKLGENARSAMAPSLSTQNNNWSCQLSASRRGFNADIIELSNLRSNQPNIRTIYQTNNRATLTDVQLHWNADKMIFTSADDLNRLQVYQINTDGTDFKQVTNIPEHDVECFDAAYLPDGRLVVCTNMGYNGVPCVNGSDMVGNYSLYNPKDNSLRRLTFDQDNNWNATVLENGKVMYTRWEYTDLMHYYSRMVFTMNPDGTEQKALFGSGAMFPNSTFDMQQIPGTPNSFIGVISGHHGIARSGRLIIFNPSKARKGVEGMVQELPFSQRPIETVVKDQLVNDVWPQFLKPHPLNDKYFLVTAKLTPQSLWGIYLIDIYDNLTLIAEYEGEGLINPIPVMKRKTPMTIPDKIKPGDKTATIFIQDIYDGEGLQGVPRGTVKQFRILAYEYAYVQSLSDHIGQGIQSGWDIKRILGYVPVEKDGSVLFTIPANTPISMQPIDSMGRAIQWMRSWTVGMPGEIVSCVGCHEDQNKIPIPKRVIASTIKPHKIEEPKTGVRAINFEMDIQPILDRTCIGCHNGDKLAGGIDYTSGRYDSITDWAGTRWFSKSYLKFHPYFYRQGPEAEMAVLNPYEYSAYNSDMIRMLKYGHHNVSLTEDEWKTLYLWLDFNVPYHNTMRISNIKRVGEKIDQGKRRIELGEKYANTSVDWKKEIADYAEVLKNSPKPQTVIPEPMKEPKAKNLKAKGFPFDAATAKQMQGENARMTIELAPGVNMNFVKIPAGSYVMGNNKVMSAPKKVVKINKAFWLGEIEVSNEQMRTMLPNHDSRCVGQFWKDHTTPGYPINAPELSATKVSYDEAMEFCKKLSEKTGKSFTLPTEEQWEWAARAGSESDFWFGDSNTDYATYENMGDHELTKMAVSGIDPQPMSKNDPWYNYLNYIPKDEHVDDGNMLLTKGGSYKPNPWGLYDMNGNVAEWTKSTMYPDQNNQSTPEIVVRGGSWYDRAKNSTASSRRSFLPWIKVWNTGFRIVMEDN